MILAAVVFNAALVFQRYANDLKTPCTHLLHKAKNDVLFPFVVINNLAFEHKLGNTAQSIEYFEFLAFVKIIFILN